MTYSLFVNTFFGKKGNFGNLITNIKMELLKLSFLD